MTFIDEAIVAPKPANHWWALLREWFYELDPRVPVAGVLLFFLVLGLTVLGFNRTPLQILATSVSCVLFDSFLSRVFNGRWSWSLSPLITSFSLSFLLNYSHDFALLFVPVYLAIGSKYLLRFNGRHFFNPAMFAVAASLLFSEELITAAPAYQWNGLGMMSVFVFGLGMLFVIPKVHRQWLVLSFLTMFTIQTALRAYIMRHHLPFETLFLGTLSSPSFFIFTFFMITDPMTSPKKRSTQIYVGIAIALVDLIFHLYQSYYTFFYAGLVVASARFIYFHGQKIRREGLGVYFTRDSFKRISILASIALIGVASYRFVINPQLTINNLPWRFVEVPAALSGLKDGDKGEIYELIDPRVQHIAKWTLSVGDGVAVGDVDGDGKQDIFLTNVLKRVDERAALYRNLGGYKFKRVPIPALDETIRHPEKYGLITNAMFVDYDNSGVKSIFLTVAFGHPILLKNMLKKTGRLEFKDVTREVGLADLYTNSISATFADFNKDGLLDLLILNVWPENLPDYKTPHQLNLFHLPPEEYVGDNRPYNFMHDSWNLANNGGGNLLFLQDKKHHFVKQDSKKWGLPETRWSLAVGVADLNHDGWPDIYIANDFGPDDMYYNVQGKGFENIKGTIFGSVGRDTYKGMNVSIADFDRTGYFGIYISDVHHAFQAEGSLLWMFSPSADPWRPTVTEQASAKNVLNENRFGWGGVASDFDNSGWFSLAQANGMVDDTWDKKYEKCPDYWYVNEKVARAPPSIHRYANKWGDLRGYCIYGKEQNRIYLNRGGGVKPQFVDVASAVGVTELTNSRGVAAADFENRGRMDLLFTHQFAAPTLYKNEYVDNTKPDANSWVTIALQSLDRRCNREALGTKVTLNVEQTDGRHFSIAQEKQLVSGFEAQADTRLHFGLGAAVKNVSAVIDWCYGVHREVKENLEINRFHDFVLRDRTSSVESRRP